jgi:hypothetical protein
MHTANKYGRRLARGIVAGTILTLGLSTGAFAQAGSPPANVKVGAPKQVGAWTVIAWSQGYCAAERPLPGAAEGGGTLQFVVARLRIGYRLALSAQDWELMPSTTFPIEFSAQPVMRSDTNAIAVSPKLVIIELGADGQFVRKLATAPMIEIKAAQATFKLPTEGLAEAFAELDTCFGALKQPASNPFAARSASPQMTSSK